ncbi:unnamed protein product [Lymnaea stagnalis]|uniref:G-protein coupled receptors family 1 profile domain-containing protein n=1 Tax=Lymnaea stagnalis TaxID=6523 RepID=A0AAV2H5C8_LYMST
MSNSCANPIIYGFTNDSFRADMAVLCYFWFPFCHCMKKLANRKLSVSTNDSAYNKRFSTMRKTQSSSYRQGVYRNGSKVYIELRRDNMSRGRSLGSMNEFYRETLDVELRDSYSNGLCGRCCHLHHSCNPKSQHLSFINGGDYRCSINTHSQPALHRSVSGSSALSTSSVNNIDLDQSIYSTTDDIKVPYSQESPTTLAREFLFVSRMDDTSSGSYRLNPLPEVEMSDIAEFNSA